MKSPRTLVHSEKSPAKWYMPWMNPANMATALSNGWEVKSSALEVAWKDVEQRIEAARQKVINKEASPILFFMEYRVMDIPIVAAYTGFWKWQVKKHMKYSVFEKLSHSKLEKYAALIRSVGGRFKNNAYT